MRLSRMSIFAALSSAFVAMTEAISAFARSIGDFILMAFAWLAPEPMRFADGGFTQLAPSGAPLEPSLIQSMRHESGVPRRSAARNI